MYYGKDAGIFTFTVVATDTLAKLDTLTFPDTTLNGQSYDIFGITTTLQPYGYAFEAADSFSQTVSVTVTDRARNETIQPVWVVNDEVAPTIAITAPASSGMNITLNWWGLDVGAGIREYEVQYRDGAGAWTDWLTGTTQLTANFRGKLEHTYTFRVRAWDNVNNGSDWLETGPVEVVSVTKYYHFGAGRVAMRQGKAVYYLSGDHLGSTSLTTDSNGNVFAESRYLPYGGLRWQAGTLPTDFTYTGQREEGFGLLDYNARYYSSVLGRFISPDTIVPRPANPQSLNRYSYVLNRPLQGGDPSGHDGPLEEFWTKVKTKYQKTTDKVLGYKEGGKDPGNWIDSDWAGRMILDRYLYGLGDDWEIENDSDWTAYMKAHDGMREDMRIKTIEIAQSLYSSGKSQSIIDKTFHQTLTNGESVVGYQYLNGSNADVGDFQIKGNATWIPNPVGVESTVILDASYTFNDIIDPNLKYSTDTVKDKWAQRITLGLAQPYDIHITWNERTAVRLDQNGGVVSIRGEWLGD